MEQCPQPQNKIDGIDSAAKDNGVDASDFSDLGVASSRHQDEGHRRFRDGFLRDWTGTDFKRVSSDEVLSRLAHARNISSLSSNRLMLIAATLAFLYFLRVQNLAGDLKIGTYNLANLPFGHFVLCATALIASSVSFARNGDSRSYDRYLRLVCDQRFDCDSNLAYLSYPNEHAWGEPFSRMVFLTEEGKILNIFRGIGMFALNLCIMLLMYLPIISGIYYLCNSRAISDMNFILETNIIIAIFLSINILTILIVIWARATDRD